MSSSNVPIKIDTSMTAMVDPYAILATTPIQSKSINESPISPVSTASPKSIIGSPRSSPFDTPSPRSKPSRYSPIKTMKNKGYVPFKSLGTTLQGSVYRVKSKTMRGTSIVKQTKKSLHSKSVAVVNGTEIAIKEDVLKETAILRYLSSDKCAPPQLAKFESFFSDKHNYYLVQEDGGSGLFEFVSKCHKFIENGRLSIAEWLRFCKIAFKQMVDLMDWMHNKMSCCHLDISLENFVIDNVLCHITKENTIEFADDFIIKIIDFGLAEVFTSTQIGGSIDFQSVKYVGKTQYKAPKVYAQTQVFDASAADVWSLGICFFMMVVGGAPYNRPSEADVAFRCIISGQLIKLLDEWKRIDYVTPKLVHLLTRMLTTENKRLNIAEISRHPWFL